MKTIKDVIKDLNKKDFTIHREVYPGCIYFRIDRIKTPVTASLYINFYPTYISFFNGVCGDAIDIKYDDESPVLDLFNVLIPEIDNELGIEFKELNKTRQNIILRLL